MRYQAVDISLDGLRVVNDQARVLKSTDNGATFIEEPTPTQHDTTVGLFTLKNRNGVKLAGGGPAFYGLCQLIVDRGTGWINVNLGMLADSILGLYFKTDSEIYAFCRSGLILKSNDTGNTWLIDDSQVGWNKVLYEADGKGNTLVAVGWNGLIIKLNASGGWDKKVSPTPFDNNGNQHNLYGVSFTDENRGAACGGHYVIVTENGGDNWTNIVTPLIDGYDDLRFCKRIGDTIYACGMFGSIVKVELVAGNPQFTTWRHPMVPDFYGCDFSDGITGYVCGGHSAAPDVLLRTTDGITFADPDTGIVMSPLPTSARSNSTSPIQLAPAGTGKKKPTGKG